MPYPDGKPDSFGTLGFNLSRFSKWAKGANPNSSSGTISGSFNFFAHYDEPKLFWRNAGGIAVGWQKLDTDTDDPSDTKYETVADVFRINSLFGYKLSDKWSLSAMGDYNSSILKNFNDPGILDLGVGATWTPISNMVVTINPANYHIVMGDNPAFDSGLGTKVIADYSTSVKGISWRSNFNTFLAYKSTDPALSEWTWTNSFGAKVWSGVGVGLEFALRKAEVENEDLQSYLILGLSYAF